MIFFKDAFKGIWYHSIPMSWLKKKKRLKKYPDFMPDNEIMLTFQKFLSSLNWLEFQFI